MKPLQELVYNPADAGTQLRQIENIEWQNGRYNFTQFNLEHLTRIINQMYGSRIIISDKVNKIVPLQGVSAMMSLWKTLLIKFVLA